MWCMKEKLLGHTAVGRNNLNWCVCGLHLACIGEVIVYIEVFNSKVVGENIDERVKCSQRLQTGPYDREGWKYTVGD